MQEEVKSVDSHIHSMDIDGGVSESSEDLPLDQVLHLQDPKHKPELQGKPGAEGNQVRNVLRTRHPKGYSASRPRDTFKCDADGQIDPAVMEIAPMTEEEKQLQEVMDKEIKYQSLYSMEEIWFKA